MIEVKFGFLNSQGTSLYIKVDRIEVSALVLYTSEQDNMCL